MEAELASYLSSARDPKQWNALQFKYKDCSDFAKAVSNFKFADIMGPKIPWQLKLKCYFKNSADIVRNISVYYLDIEYLNFLTTDLSARLTKHDPRPVDLSNKFVFKTIDLAPALKNFGTTYSKVKERISEENRVLVCNKLIDFCITLIKLGHIKQWRYAMQFLVDCELCCAAYNAFRLNNVPYSVSTTINPSLIEPFSQFALVYKTKYMIRRIMQTIVNDKDLSQSILKVFHWHILFGKEAKRIEQFDCPKIRLWPIIHYLIRYSIEDKSNTRYEWVTCIGTVPQLADYMIRWAIEINDMDFFKVAMQRNPKYYKFIGATAEQTFNNVKLNLGPPLVHIMLKQ